jgi:phosphomecalonate degydratase small subunit
MNDAPLLTLQGPPGYGPIVEGEALVSRQGFNARYDMDRRRGVFSRPEHDLFGQPFAGRILVFTTAKGGVATSWALHDLRAKGLAPAGLLFQQANPIVVQGAVFAELPILHRLEPDPVETLHNGDWLRIDPERGLVEVLRRAQTGGS